MSTLLVFGAGASHWNPDCQPYPPPPGPKLFDALVEAGGVARTVSAELASVFRSDFELGMAEFCRARPRDVARFQRDMAAYLVQFVPGESNYYQVLVDRVRESGASAVFATTNYDLLIEHCISRRGLGIRYHELPVPRDRVSVLKIHGSCNFLPDYGDAQFHNVQVGFVEGGALIEAPVRLAQSSGEVEHFCRTDTSFAPALTLYAKGKQAVACPSYVANQQRHFAAAAQAASYIVVVGLRVVAEDRHIWEPLKKSTAWIGYVGPDGDDFLSWAQCRGKRRKSQVFAQSFEESLPLISRLL